MRDIPNKTPGAFYYAAECTDMFSEEENIITDAGIVLSAGDLRQISKAVANYSGAGDFYLDTGGFNAYVLGPTGLKQAPTAYVAGLRARFFPNSSNTSSIVTVNINSLGTKNIVRANGNPLAINEIHVNLENIIVYDGVNFRLVSSSSVGHNDPISPQFKDCILSNNTTDPNKDIDFGPGYFRAENADLTFHNISTITKQADAPWVEGSGVGGMTGGTLTANNWYHEFYIAKDDGTVGCGYDVSRTAVNLLALGSGLGYKYYSRRSSFYSNASNNISLFLNKDNTFWWNSTPFEVTTIPAASFSSIIIPVPLGVVTEVKCEYIIAYSVGVPGSELNIEFRSLIVPGFTQVVIAGRHISDIFEPRDVGKFDILSNTNSQIEFRKNIISGLSPIQTSALRAVAYTELYNQ